MKSAQNSVRSQAGVQQGQAGSGVQWVSTLPAAGAKEMLAKQRPVLPAHKTKFASK